MQVHAEILRLRRQTMGQFSIPYFPCLGFSTDLRIIFHNVQSLHKYIEDVRADPNNKVADICMFAQTRLRKTEPVYTYFGTV